MLKIQWPSRLFPLAINSCDATSLSTIWSRVAPVTRARGRHWPLYQHRGQSAIAAELPTVADGMVYRLRSQRLIGIHGCLGLAFICLQFSAFVEHNAGGSRAWHPELWNVWEYYQHRHYHHHEYPHSSILLKKQYIWWFLRPGRNMVSEIWSENGGGSWGYEGRIDGEEIQAL